MCDPTEEKNIAAKLVDAVFRAAGRQASLDGLLVTPSCRRVVVVNSNSDEQAIWAKCAQSILGPTAKSVFVERPLGPRTLGVSMVAARGRGTLDFQTFECGCRAAQIPGEDDWQLIRGAHCRFADSEHRPREWPIDSIIRPLK
jgi:hypothetical protein